METPVPGRSASESMTERRLATVSLGAPESQVSTRSVPVKVKISRLAHPVKVELSGGDELGIFRRN